MKVDRKPTRLILPGMVAVPRFSLITFLAELLLGLATSASAFSSGGPQASVLPPVDPAFGFGLAVLRKSTGIIEGLPEGNCIDWMPNLQVLIGV